MDIRDFYFTAKSGLKIKADALTGQIGKVDCKLGKIIDTHQKYFFHHHTNVLAIVGIHPSSSFCFGFYL